VFVIAERTHAPEATATTLRAHDRVVRRIAERVNAVLPFRFGSVAEDPKTVVALVGPLQPLVDKALAQVRGCVQFTLRVRGEPARPRARAPRGGPGTRFLTALVEAKRVPEIAPLTKATRPFVRASRSERHDRPPLLASVYHLVPRGRERAYRAAVERSLAALEVSVRVAGPFPPYAFAELT
jgi:hypothetical protein